MKKSLVAALGAAAVAASTINGASAASSSKTTTKHTGPWVDMPWGPVRATVYLKGSKLKKVSIATSPENPRSAFIDDQAVPMLKQETLQAQSYKIDLIGGATMTSEAYQISLEHVLKKVHFKIKK